MWWGLCLASRQRLRPLVLVRNLTPFTPALLSLPPRPVQPKEIKTIQEFLKVTRRSDARAVKIKTSTRTKKVNGKFAKRENVTKFKVRCSRYLYTLCVPDLTKAKKLKLSLPPGTLCVFVVRGLERLCTVRADLPSSCRPAAQRHRREVLLSVSMHCRRDPHCSHPLVLALLTFTFPLGVNSTL